MIRRGSPSGNGNCAGADDDAHRDDQDAVVDDRDRQRAKGKGSGLTRL
jgi:hypothetical protein